MTMGSQIESSSSSSDPFRGRLAVSLAEAARIMGISERHARDLVAEGVIKTISLGSKRMVTEVEVRRLLDLDQD
jgi:excisionase family DNA binding protein